MTLTWLLDDDAIEAMVWGDEVDPRLDRLAAFARQARAIAEGPPPPASPDLAVLLATGDTSVPTITARALRHGHNGRFTPVATRVAGLSLAAKVALGASVAAAGTLGAGAAGVLPGGADGWVRDAIEAVTPVEFGPAGDMSNVDDRFGARVSGDATGETDGEPGVDGQEISDEAPGAEHRSTDPGAPGSVPGQADAPRGGGLGRAQDTPAAPRLPGELPAGAGQPQSPPAGGTTPTSIPPQGPKGGAANDAGAAGGQAGQGAAGSQTQSAPADGSGSATPNAQPTSPVGP
jgi:hypothetical protein